MKYALDLVIVMLIVVCAISGSQKGAVRMLIKFAGYTAAIAAAVFVSNVASDYVYENLVKPHIMSVLESKAESLGNEYVLSDEIYGIFEKNGILFDEEQLSITENNTLLDNEEIYEEVRCLFKEYCKSLTSAFSGVVPDEIMEEAERYIEENNLETERMLTLITQERENVIKIVESEIIKPVMMKTVKIILFAITFAIVMIIVSIISWTAKLIRQIPVINSADNFFGTILGLMQGLLYTTIVNLCVSMFIKFTSDSNEFLNTTIISETYVFEFLYNVTLNLLH